MQFSAYSTFLCREFSIAKSVLLLDFSFANAAREVFIPPVNKVANNVVK